jgi:hypothetical protein
MRLALRLGVAPNRRALENNIVANPLLKTALPGRIEYEALNQPVPMGCIKRKVHGADAARFRGSRGCQAGNGEETGSDD